MKIGVRGHDLGIQDNISNLIKKTKDIGFSYIQLVLKKTLKNETGKLSEHRVNKIKDEFQKNNVKIAMLCSYFNPVHSNKEKLKADIIEFKNYLRYANMFGCNYVGTETGSYNDDLWTYNPKNHTDEAFNELVIVVKDLINEAEKYNSYVAIEPAYNHVIHNSVMLKRLIEEIQSDNLVVTIDLYNLLNLNNYKSHNEIFKEFLTLFKDRIKIFHFKDFIIENNELVRVGIGEGLMDYEYIMNLIKEEFTDTIMIFEGVPEDKLSSSLEYINKLCCL